MEKETSKADKRAPRTLTQRSAYTPQEASLSGKRALLRRQRDLLTLVAEARNVSEHRLQTPRPHQGTNDCLRDPLAS